MCTLSWYKNHTTWYKSREAQDEGDIGHDLLTKVGSRDEQRREDVRGESAFLRAWSARGCTWFREELVDGWY